jgi:hypothetical protein
VGYFLRPSGLKTKLDAQARFDIASEGASSEEASANLIEALTLFFETAARSEVARRFHSELFVTQVEVPVR